MRIHKEGYTILGVAFLVLLCFHIGMMSWGLRYSWHRWLLVVSGFGYLFLLYFFRDPQRDWVVRPGAVIAPADGCVVAIEQVYEPEYFQDERIKISIFLSVLDVHVNRVPVAGKVGYFKYHPGDYLVAWHPKSSTKNERTSLVIVQEDGQAILVRQIAGILARRIVCDIAAGDEVRQSEAFGFIKFGSRLDVYLPLTAKVLVDMAEVVRGGVSSLAELPGPS